MEGWTPQKRLVMCWTSEGAGTRNRSEEGNRMKSLVIRADTVIRWAVQEALWMN